MIDNFYSLSNSRRRNLLILGCLILFIAGCQNTGNQNREEGQEKPEISYEDRIPHMLDYDVNEAGFPRSVEPNGSIRKVKSSDWTSGFYPGSLLYLYRLTENEAYLEAAQKWLPFSAIEQTNDGTHDMGFKIYCSIGNANEIVPDSAWQKVIVKSAATLSTRFNENTSCIKSWDFGGDRWQFPVIIDNMMNLELLFEASKISGNQSFHDIAVSHAVKTMENHFREDHSSYHVLDYDPQTGEILQRLTHQGIHAKSVWSRGQAWGLYGFTMTYRYTEDARFLDKAIAIADFIMSLPDMPKDKVPYWDMSDPKIPNAVRDASAAAITASALLELNSFMPGKGYGDYALSILNSLNSGAYVLPSDVEGPFILDHSTGNYPAKDELDVPINYADYYFLEALYRSKTGQF
ncbi:MAG: glycoside hydrolase family 88 protein [Cytophagales bacterium]|nr:glycoside hydrolase family 88 protein [Cytophagales bacterium]